jgi:hypothetical protein
MLLQGRSSGVRQMICFKNSFLFSSRIVILVRTRRYETREFVTKPKGLPTFLGRCFLGAGCVAKAVSKLGSDDDFVLLESLGVEPHQACLLHMLEQDGLVFLGCIFQLV